MKKGLIIGGITLMVAWVCGVSFFLIQQIGWNHYIVEKTNENIDVINSYNQALYTPATDDSIVR